MSLFVDGQEASRFNPLDVWKQARRASTTVALPASTLVGLVRTANANGALGALDGVTLVPGVDSILDRHSTGGLRGLWDVVSLGSAGTPWVLSLSPDAATSADLRSGTTVEIQEGSDPGVFYTLRTPNPIVPGVTVQSWSTPPSSGSSGPAGGDLAGTYPDPLIAALSVTDAKVAAANKDGLAATPSLRTLGTGAQQAAAGTTLATAESYADAGDTATLTSAKAFASTSPTGRYVVAKNGNDTTGNGSLVAPFLTVAKAMSTIGSATTVGQLNDDAQARYVVEVYGGVYTEDVAIPFRQLIRIHLYGAVIVGNLTWNCDSGIATAGKSQFKLLIQGDDLRAAQVVTASSNQPVVGIDGNITCDPTTESPLGGFWQLHLLGVGVTGNVIVGNSAPGSNHSLQLFMEDSGLKGKFSCAASGASGTLYCSNSDTSGTYSIGTAGAFAVQGPINLNILRCARFTGKVVVNSAHGRWRDVIFDAGQAHDFTGSSGAISMDANSAESYTTNVPTKGGETITRADTSRGVGYTPTTAGDWSGSPVTALAGLDRLASAVAILRGSPVP